MQFYFTEKFKRDYKKLKSEHRNQFENIFETFMDDLENHLIHKSPMPAKYRFKILRQSDGVMSMTWYFSRPAGRATFHIEEQNGKPVLVWRRIGSNEIYREN